MVPKDIGKEYRPYESLRAQRINMSSAGVLRRRQGPVTRQPSPLEEMRLACIKGDLIAVQNLIEGGRASVNGLLDDGWSPLMVAASAARPALVEYLLLQNADPNLTRKDNFTALMAAAGSSQTRTGDTRLCVTLLLQAGSYVNAKDNNGVTPLGYAVKENKYDAAKCLIGAGANLDSLDRNGRNCLFYAAEKGFGQVARLLLESGVSIDTVDRNGWMVGEAAVEKGHYKLGNLLFRVRESRWRPGKSPALMTAFNDVPEPLATEPDPDMGEGIVNILTNIQAQVRCLSNLINSVRMRMFQDVTTKEYEVEAGKIEELVVFARSMGKSCAILSNQVSSLNILLDGETRIHSFDRNESNIIPTIGNNNCYNNGNNKNSKNKPIPPRRSSKSSKKSSPPLTTPPAAVSPSPTPSTEEMTPTKPGYIYSNYYSYYKKQQQNRSGWNILMAGAAVSVMLLCAVTPHLRTRLPTMRLWKI